MTREEAIKVIKNFPVESTGERKAVILAIEALEQEQQSEWERDHEILKAYADGQESMKPCWIPVSERLPEFYQRVLVTAYGRVCYAMMISADGNGGYPIFKLQDSLNEKVVCETTVHSEFTRSRITAWMPLPQPYKGESEDAE